MNLFTFFISYCQCILLSAVVVRFTGLVHAIQADKIPAKLSVKSVQPPGSPTGRTIRAVHYGKSLTRHPDLGVELICIQIPKWDKILDIAVTC